MDDREPHATLTTASRRSLVGQVAGQGFLGSALPHGLASRRGNNLPALSSPIPNPPGTLTAPLRGLSSTQIRKEIPIHERIGRGTRGVKDGKNELLAGSVRL